MKKNSFLIIAMICSFQPGPLKEESMDVEIVGPKMDDLINKLWNELPTDCVKLPAHVTNNSESESCASIALKHFRGIINSCKMNDAFKAAIKLEFKLLKLIPAGKLAGTILDIADLTSKALSADSPESFEADLLKYGFGKTVGDEMLGKLKKLVDVPAGEAGDVFGNLVKLFYKEMWDKIKKEIFPKGEKMECRKEGTCDDNIYMSMEAAPPEDEKMIAKLVFSANGDCHCQLGCTKGQPGELLKDWNVHGELAVMLDKAEVVEKGIFFKKKVLQVTLRAERPSYTITASCDCPTNNSNISYDPTDGNGTATEIAFGGTMLRADEVPAYSSFGPSVSISRFLTNNLAVTVDAGFFPHKKTEGQYSFTKNFLNITGGITWLPPTPLLLSRGRLSTHLLAGISSLKQKSTTMGVAGPTFNSTAFSMLVGGAVDWGNGRFRLRLPQVDFAPGFFGGSVQANYRVGVGGVYRWH